MFPTAPASTVPEIRRLLRERGMTAAQLAGATGIAPAEISRILRRAMRPTDAQAKRIFEALGELSEGIEQQRKVP